MTKRKSAYAAADEKKIRSVDEYIRVAPAHARALLSELRSAIRAVAHDAVERISYSVPPYHFEGGLAYFAFATSHVGL